MLVLAGQHGDQELVVRILPAQIFHGPDLRFPDAAPGDPELGIHRRPRADHQGKRFAKLLAHRQHAVAEAFPAQRVFRKRKLRRQRCREVQRVQLAHPVTEKTADFGHRSGVHRRLDGIPPFNELPPRIAVVVKERVEPQHALETWIRIANRCPEFMFHRIERIVGHDNLADAGDIKHLADVVLVIQRGEIRAIRLQIAAGHVEPQPGKDRQHAARGLAHRRVVDEQGRPDQFGLTLLRQCEEIVVGHVRKPEELRHQIVVGQQFVDSPQRQLLELGRVDVGVDIGDRYGTQHLAKHAVKIAPIDSFVVHHDLACSLLFVERPWRHRR